MKYSPGNLRPQNDVLERPSSQTGASQASSESQLLALAPTNLRALAAVLSSQADSIEATAISRSRTNDPWLDLRSAPTQVPIAVPTLRRWVREGRLRSCVAERGRIIFRRSWLDEAIEKNGYRPRPKTAVVPEPTSLEAWEQAAAKAVSR
ncbi:MAG: hypothetical protein SFV15_16330 [Polyangiaceae bacterium]|nr:hypothetical protein [Polyangiaceae bacterium]